MDDIRVDCQGFRVGRWSFPPFVLRRGERFALHMPSESRINDRDQIIPALTGSAFIPGLTLHGSVVWAQYAQRSTGWRHWFSDQRPFAWLKRNTSLTDDAIESILTEHNIDRRFGLSCSGGNPKLILGLYAALAQHPAVLVYETHGADPLGKVAAHQIVARHLTQCAALFVSWPWICQGREGRDEVPGAVSIPISDSDVAVRSVAAAQ